MTFYFALQRSYKLSFNEVQYNEQNSSEFLTFPDFKIYQSSKTFSQPKRASISLGLSYKKQRFYFSLQNDGVSSKNYIYVNAYDFTTNTYHNDVFRGTGRSVQSRFSLNHDFLIIQKEKKTNLFISSSLGLCYRSGPKGIGEVGSLEAGGNLEPTKKIIVNSTSYTNEDKYAVNVGVGIGSDLHFKERYLFTLSANFYYSKKSLYFTKETVSIQENNSIQHFVFNSNHLCTAIHFGISRRFQFYPWKPIKKIPIIEELQMLIRL